MNILGITFKAPFFTHFWIVFFLITLLLMFCWFRTYHLLKILGKTVSGKKFLRNTSLFRITLKTILLLLGSLFLFVALARPARSTKEITVHQEGRNIFIALDLSKSMLAQDQMPNRLEFAKKYIHSLVNTLEAERVGLILFSGSSFIQCPLTRDHAAFFMYLKEADVHTIASGSTALDQAITQALQGFKSITSNNKLLVIFSDGEDFSSNLASIKQEAHKQNLTIFTVGIGTVQGAPIPLSDEAGTPQGHLKDKKGTVVITQLNEGILQTLAHDVDGFYFNARDQNVWPLVEKIKKHEMQKFEERTFTNLEEHYNWCLLVSFLFFAGEWLL